MTDPFLVIINLIGGVFFVLAVLWGLFNYRENIGVSEFWMVYSLASVAGGLLLFSRAVEWAGVMPQMMDNIQPFFAIVGVTLLLVAALTMVYSPIEHQVR